MNLVPRHEQIVGRILGNEHARILTIIIGFSEIVMAIWIITNYKPRLNAITQIAVILSMNILEFVITPDLLLWGRFNLFFAILFICVIYYQVFFRVSKKEMII